MENIENQPELDENVILYKRRESQRIPLISNEKGIQQRCWYLLNPLSDERYFQYEDECEILARTNPAKISEIYKPKYTLGRDLLIDREGAKETDTDVLFVECVQAANALLYYQTFPIKTAEEGELLDDDAEAFISFGAMYSGALLELEIGYDSHFINKIDDFRATQLGKRQLGLSVRSQQKTQRLHSFALQLIKSSRGYEKTENVLESVPAWHIVSSVSQLYLSSLNLLSASPLIVGGQ